jgi:hypothetical protein
MRESLSMVSCKDLEDSFMAIPNKKSFISVISTQDYVKVKVIFFSKMASPKVVFSKSMNSKRLKLTQNQKTI